MSEHVGHPPYEKLDLKLDRKKLIGVVADSVEYTRSIGEPVKMYRFGFFRLQFVPTRLQEGYSLHVWSPELFLERDEAPHNHNSFMKSRVLLGRITNLFWGPAKIDPKGHWRPVETICTDTVCEDRPADYRVNFKLLGRKTYCPGSPNGDYYEMPKGTIHSTEFDPGTITLIHKSQIDPEEIITNMLPHDKSVRPAGFDITSYPQDKAWAEIDKAMQRLKS